MPVINCVLFLLKAKLKHQFEYLSPLKQLISCVFLFGVFTNIATANSLNSKGLQYIDEYINDEVTQKKLPGAVILAANKKGDLLHKSVFGYRDVENKAVMTEDTLFRIYSMSKIITGVGLMTLYEAGKFELDDPVSKYIPSFKNVQVYSGRDSNGKIKTERPNHPITIHELITHSAGFVYIPPYSRGEVANLYGEADILNRFRPLNEMIEELGNIPLAFQPGTRQIYGMSVDIQGHLIELLSGKSLDVFLDDEIFSPLKMDNTGFSTPSRKKNLLSRRYNFDVDGNLVSKRNDRFLTQPALLSGGNGLVSSAKDYLQFCLMIINKGELNGTRILKPETVEFMRNMELPRGVVAEPSYFPGSEFKGYFSTVLSSGQQRDMPEGSIWWWGLTGTWFWIDDKNDFIFIGMSQIDDFRYFRSLVSQTRRLMYN